VRGKEHCPRDATPRLWGFAMLRMFGILKMPVWCVRQSGLVKSKCPAGCSVLSVIPGQLPYAHQPLPHQASEANAASPSLFFRGNMCLEETDAIVNAANIFLKNNGGVAAAIRKAAKPDVTESSHPSLLPDAKLPQMLNCRSVCCSIQSPTQHQLPRHPHLTAFHVNVISSELVPRRV
jgi:hypothetical protein